MSVSFYVTSTGEEHINMANANAARILSLVGITGEDVYYGSLEASEVPALQRAVLRALNADDAVSSATREASVDRSVRVENGAIVRGPTVYTAGIDEEYVKRRLTDLLELLKEAQEQKSGICWS